jgi:CTP-dependent riboflavin kinase
MDVRGRIESGLGEAAYFTSLTWVVDGVQECAGFALYPGTLNVRVAAEDVADLRSFLADFDFQLDPDVPQFCAARFKRILVEHLPCLAVLPHEDVRFHGEDLVEIIADRHLKRALGVADGDYVTLRDPQSPAGP